MDGTISAERFITLIKRGSFDYTAWHREYFDKKKPGQVLKEAIKVVI